MALFRYSDPEIHRRLARAVALRWPRETLLLTTACQAARTATRGFWAVALVNRDHVMSWEGARQAEEGFVGVTQARLIYQERTRHGLIFRLTALLLSLLAVASLFSGGSIGRFLAAATGAVLLWLGAKAVEAFGIGSGYVEFGRIWRIDREAQRIDGEGRWGIRYRIRIPDPSDFRMIVALATGGAAAAA